jgi:hypothetical protein
LAQLSGQLAKYVYLRFAFQTIIFIGYYKFTRIKIIDTNKPVLTHILAGALMAHSAAGVRLVGGHTSEGGGPLALRSPAGRTTDYPTQPAKA